ncbi:hypothetical protein [Flexivirga meconopsidis]|uniref:hypothetical protein n=1 Tax=Flexivirga meconopsidis TaxID=2977121 RepID=UPI00223F13F1|nr:hypothetical protein [Flexivirga meconopsidis]
MATSKSAPALNLASAALAGAVTLVRPARFPRWARRSLGWANTAGTAGSVFLTVRNRDDLPPEHPLHRAVAGSDVLAAATGGLMLITSGIGLKADDKVEQFLLKRGVKHPRIWMAVGVVGVVFVAKTLQDAGSKKAEAMREQFKAADQDEKRAITDTDAKINRGIADDTAR